MASGPRSVRSAAWREAQRRARDHYWPDVDRVFGELPPRLYLQAAPLRYDLALRWSDSGRFEDVLSVPPQFPLLALGSWLLDDLGVAASPGRDALERRLFVGGVLWLGSAHVIEAIHDEASFYDRQHLALARLLTELAVANVAPVVPGSFWESYGSAWRDQLERELVLEDFVATFGEYPSLSELGPLAPWSAPARAIAMAVSHHAQREDVIARLFAMVDSIAAVARVRADLSTLHTDLERGRITYPIAILAREAGLDMHRPLPVAEFLGALVMTDALQWIFVQASRQHDVGRQIASELQLPTVASYLDEVQLAIADLQERCVPRGAGKPTQLSSGPLILPYQPVAPKALDMAERFLIADPTFFESWEMHREGLFDKAEVASRFPAGIILEVLCANGRAVAPYVDEFLSAAVRNGFRYYEHPECDADSDTLGVVLRLLTYVPAEENVLATVTGALNCVDKIVGRTGQVPVWITECDDRAASRLVRLGEGCATVEAHFLLGLIGFDFGRRLETVKRASAHLLDRVIETGIGANVNYPPLYALGVLLRLTSALDELALGADLRLLNQTARRTLVDHLERFFDVAALSPQDAALLITACLRAAKPDAVRVRWVDTVLKAQRSDGRWSAESFIPAPTRGRAVTWYASTTLTTALCYEALASWARAVPA